MQSNKDVLFFKVSVHCRESFSLIIIVKNGEQRQ